MSKSLIYHTQVEVKGEATLEADNKVATSARIDSLAKDGMIVHCDQSSLKALFPRSATFSPKQTTSVDLTFGLKEVGKVETRCDVVSVRRLSRDAFELNLKFDIEDQRSAAIIEKFVERKLKTHSIAANNSTAPEHYTARVA